MSQSSSQSSIYSEHGDNISGGGGNNLTLLVFLVITGLVILMALKGQK